MDDERQEELEWEARAKLTAGISSLVAALFVLLSLTYSVSALPRSASKAKDFLPDLHNHHSGFLAAAIISSVGLLFLIPPLVYMYRATKFRRAQLPTVARYLAIAGPIAMAVLQIVSQLQQIDAANAFVAGAVKTNKHAEALIRNHTSVVSGVLLVAHVAVGFALILISLNAMRAGLLSRFMGILGVILGALFVLPLVAAPLIQLFWFGAVGLLILDRWPGGAGRGPAWAAGEEIPWPSAAERAGRSVPAEAPEPEEPEPNEATTASNPRSRKRKKRKARR